VHDVGFPYPAENTSMFNSLGFVKFCISNLVLEMPFIGRFANVNLININTHNLLGKHFIY